VAEATIAQITTEADVGFGTFYLYFKTKEDALHAVLLEGFTPLNAQVDVIQQNAIAEQQPWEKTLREIVGAYLSFAHENRDLMQIMFAEQPRFQQGEWQVFLRFAWRIIQLLKRAHPSTAKEPSSLDSHLNGAGRNGAAYPLNLLTIIIIAILNRSAIWWLRQRPVGNNVEPEELATVSTTVAQFMIAGLSGVLTVEQDNREKDQFHDETTQK
jgi:AcrR family transcriptional regulator